jgi:DNA-binding CsgD family transcriptional regulator
MSDIIRRWPTPTEARRSRIAARNKEMKKICLILGIDYKKIEVPK